MRLESSISWNIGNFLRVVSFHFSSTESHFLKCKTFFRVPVSSKRRKFRFLKHKEFFVVCVFRTAFFWENIKSRFQDFHFMKYKKSFRLRKCRKFLNNRARKFQFSRNIRIFLGVGFILWACAEKCARWLHSMLLAAVLTNYLFRRIIIVEKVVVLKNSMLCGYEKVAL